MKHFLKGSILIIFFPILAIAMLICWLIDAIRDLGGCGDYYFCVKLDSIIEKWVN